MKIVVVGAGSSYTPELIEGFIDRRENVNIRELHLVDCEAGKEKLDIIYDLTCRMLKKVNYDVKVEKHIGWKDAIKDADFVMTQMRIGLLPARAEDERIPGKYGMLGQETNGAGGLFKAIRTIPVIFDLVDDVKKEAPNAWIVNFTNPAGLVTEAVHRYKDFDKFIGLCNVPIGMQKEIHKIMKNDKLKIDFVGLNHFVYATGVYRGKRNIIDKFLKKSFKNAASTEPANIDQESPWDEAFIKHLNVLPCGYHRYYYKKEEMLNLYLKKWAKGETRAEQVMAVEKELFEKYKDPNLSEKPAELEKRGGAYYSTAACNLVQSLATNDGKEHVINYKNNGAIANLPDDVACEYSAKIVDGKVVASLIDNKIPEYVLGDVLKMKEYEKMAAKGVATNDYQLLRTALTLNPLTIDDRKAHLLFDELYEAHKQYVRIKK